MSTDTYRQCDDPRRSLQHPGAKPSDVAGLGVRCSTRPGRRSPRLAPLPHPAALTPLLLLHLTRVLGLTMLVPGVIDPDLPRSFAVPAAYGDLIAAVLALSAVAALRMRLRSALAVAWIFSLEGIGDLVNAFIQGGRVNLPSYELGAAWFIYTALVPALS